MRVAIVGANGQLGSDLVRVIGDHADVVPLLRNQLDVRSREQVSTVIAAVRPDVVINTAAFHKVDACEENPWDAVETNMVGSLNVARACDDAKAHLVFLSTDYVFSGDDDRPRFEDDPAVPINVYGATKLAGERMAIEHCASATVVRTSGLFGQAGASGKGGNFVETMLRLGRERGVVRVVTDQTFSPTATIDLATVIWQCLRERALGVIHVTNAGECTWNEFARAIFEQSGMDVAVEPTTSSEFGARARRPAYSVLGHGRLGQLGIGGIRHWREALGAYLARRAELPATDIAR